MSSLTFSLIHNGSITTERAKSMDLFLAFLILTGLVFGGIVVWVAIAEIWQWFWYER
jgi:hypothetical protein